MKFLLSVIGWMMIAIMLLLLVAFLVRCEHEDKITTFVFQSENSTALNYVKTVCDGCNQVLSNKAFRGTPSINTHITALEEHIADNTFISGEYDTVRAKVVGIDYFSPYTEIGCCVQTGDCHVHFPVEFRNEFEESVSSLQEGDEITFYGKSALTGLSWTDCELITK